MARCGGDDYAVFFSITEKGPGIAFYVPDHLSGVADLDMDGELEIITKPMGGTYCIYDRLPDRYCMYTLPEEMNIWAIPENMAFSFYESARTFGITYTTATKSSLVPFAPVYDTLSSNFLLRRDGIKDRRGQAGKVLGTTVAFTTTAPDEMDIWTPEGVQIPTIRQQSEIMLRELVSLTDYRPERCYISGGLQSQSIALEEDVDHRSFFHMSFMLPDYNTGWERVDNSLFISSVMLEWQSQWVPWSPLRKDAVSLPGNWDGMSTQERAVWWYERSTFSNCGEIISVGAAQYEGVIKLVMSDNSFFEISLDEEGFLSTIYGPYPAGTVH